MSETKLRLDIVVNGKEKLVAAMREAQALATSLNARGIASARAFATEQKKATSEVTSHTAAVNKLRGAYESAEPGRTWNTDKLKIVRQEMAAISRSITPVRPGQAGSPFAIPVTMIRQYRQLSEVLKQTTLVGRTTASTLEDVASGSRPQLIPLTNLDKAHIKLGYIASSLQNAALHVKELGKQAQWTGRQMVVGLTIPIVGAGVRAIQTFMRLNEEFTRAHKVLGDGAWRKFSGDIKQASKDVSETFGVSRALAAGVEADFAAMGYGGKQVAQIMKQVFRTAALGDVDVSKASTFFRTMQKVFVESAKTAGGLGIKNFGQSLSATTTLMDKFNQVENKTSINVKDLAEAFPIVAQAAVNFRLSAEDTAAALAAMHEKGIDASEAATSMKFSFNSVSKPTKEARDALKSLGVNAENLGATGIEKLQKLSGILTQVNQKVGPEAEAKLAATLFGKRQSGRMLALLQSVEQSKQEINDALSKAAAAGEKLGPNNMDKFLGNTTNAFTRALISEGKFYGTTKKDQEDLNKRLNKLSEKEVKIKLSAPETQFAILKERFQNILGDIGALLLPVVNQIGGKLIGIFDRLSHLSAPMKKLIAIAAVFLAALGPIVYVGSQMAIAFGTAGSMLFKLIPGLKVISGSTLSWAEQLAISEGKFAKIGNSYVKIPGFLSKMKKGTAEVTEETILEDAGVAKLKASIDTATNAQAEYGAAAKAAADIASEGIVKQITLTEQLNATRSRKSSFVDAAGERLNASQRYGVSQVFSDYEKTTKSPLTVGGVGGKHAFKKYTLKDILSMPPGEADELILNSNLDGKLKDALLRPFRSPEVTKAFRATLEAAGLTALPIAPAGLPEGKKLIDASQRIPFSQLVDMSPAEVRRLLATSTLGPEIVDDIMKAVNKTLPDLPARKSLDTTSPLARIKAALGEARRNRLASQLGDQLRVPASEPVAQKVLDTTSPLARTRSFLEAERRKRMVAQLANQIKEVTTPAEKGGASLAARFIAGFKKKFPLKQTIIDSLKKSNPAAEEAGRFNGAGVIQSFKKVYQAKKAAPGKIASGAQSLLSSGLLTKIPLAGPLFQKLSTIVAPLGALLGTVADGIISIGLAVATALAPVLAFVGIIAVIIAAIVGFVAILAVASGHWNDFWKGLKPGIDAMVNLFKEAWSTIVDSFSAFDGVFDPIMDAVKQVGKVVTNAFGDLFGKGGKSGGDGAKGAAKDWTNLGSIIGKVFEGVGYIVKGVAEVLAFIVRLAAQLVSWILQASVAVFKFFSGFQFLEGVFSYIADIVGAIASAIQGDWTNAVKYVGRAALDLAGILVIPFDLGLKAVLKFGSVALWIVRQMVHGFDEIAGTNLEDPIKRTQQALDRLSHKNALGDFVKDLRDGIKVKPVFENAKTKDGKTPKQQGEDDVNKYAAGAKKAGPAAAKNVADAVKSIYEGFLNALKGNLDKVLGDMRQQIEDAFQKNVDDKLKAFDQQIKAIDDLTAKEEEQLKTEEYIENRRAALQKRSLDRENYRRNRALAIYEGRVDDARNLDLQFSVTDHDNTKSIADLDKGRQRDILLSQREVAKAKIQSEKDAAQAIFDIQKKAFEDQLALITQYTPKNVAEWQTMINSIDSLMDSYGVPRLHKSWQDAMGTFVTEVNKTKADMQNDAFWNGELPASLILAGWISKLTGISLTDLFTKKGTADGNAYADAYSASVDDAHLPGVDPAPKPDKPKILPQKPTQTEKNKQQRTIEREKTTVQRERNDSKIQGGNYAGLTLPQAVKKFEKERDSGLLGGAGATFNNPSFGPKQKANAAFANFFPLLYARLTPAQKDTAYLMPIARATELNDKIKYLTTDKPVSLGKLPKKFKGDSKWNEILSSGYADVFKVPPATRKTARGLLKGTTSDLPGVKDEKVIVENHRNRNELVRIGYPSLWKHLNHLQRSNVWAISNSDISKLNHEWARYDATKDLKHPAKKPKLSSALDTALNTSTDENSPNFSAGGGDLGAGIIDTITGATPAGASTGRGKGKGKGKGGSKHDVHHNVHHIINHTYSHKNIRKGWEAWKDMKYNKTVHQVAHHIINHTFIGHNINKGWEAWKGMKYRKDVDQTSAHQIHHTYQHHNVNKGWEAWPGMKYNKVVQHHAEHDIYHTFKSFNVEGLQAEMDIIAILFQLSVAKIQEVMVGQFQRLYLFVASILGEMSGTFLKILSSMTYGMAVQMTRFHDIWTKTWQSNTFSMVANLGLMVTALETSMKKMQLIIAFAMIGFKNQWSGIASLFRDPLNWVVQYAFNAFMGILTLMAAQVGADHGFSGFGTLAVPKFHSGGVVGDEGKIPGVLKPQERVAILLKGEEVLTQRQRKDRYAETGDGPGAAAASFNKYGINNSIGPGATRRDFANAFLPRILAPITDNNLTLMAAWMAGEGTAARYNPLATTNRMPGSTDFNRNNGYPVQNYKSFEDGIAANTKAILQNAHGYPAIVSALRQSLDPKVAASAIAHSAWGTGQNVLRVLGAKDTGYGGQGPAASAGFDIAPFASLFEQITNVATLVTTGLGKAGNLARGGLGIGANLVKTYMDKFAAEHQSVDLGGGPGKSAGGGGASTFHGVPGDGDLADIRNNMGVPGSFKALIRYMQKSGVPNRVTSTTDGTGHVKNSYHYKGRAVDFAVPGNYGNDTPGLKDIFYAFKPIENMLVELIHANVPYNIKNYAHVPPYAVADHHDHVHAALKNGGLVKKTSGGMLAKLGEGMFDEMVMPLPQGINGFLKSFQTAKANQFGGFLNNISHASGNSRHENVTVVEEHHHWNIEKAIGEKQWFDNMFKQHTQTKAAHSNKTRGVSSRVVNTYKSGNRRTAR